MATPTLFLAAGYLRNRARHGEYDAWLTHGRLLADRLGLAGDDWARRQELPAEARRIVAAHEAPVDRLTEAAAESGQPFLVAIVHVSTACKAVA
jgi:hypothetical protein